MVAFSQEASRQWAVRPADQRFWTLEDALIAATKFRQASDEKFTPLEDMRVISSGGDLRIHNKDKDPGNALGLTHYATGQLCRLVGAPSSYIQSLDGTLAAQNLNYGFARVDPGKVNILANHEDRRVHALTSERYDRVWNKDVLGWLVRNKESHGGQWRPPPAWGSGPGARAATVEDTMAASIVKVGDMIQPSGVYVSDHDMFVYLVHDKLTVDDNGHPLYIGQFMKNSEVGDCSLGGMVFLFDFTCGNHNVWGVKDTFQWSVRHIKGEHSSGRTLQNGRTKQHQMVSGLDRQRLGMEQLIIAARAKVIASGDATQTTREAVVEEVSAFAKKRSLPLSQTIIDGAFTIAEQNPRYGAPNTVWALN